MRLYFARHGQSEANTQHIISNREVPLGLTSLGKAQASILAEKLEDMPIRQMFCSPVYRARQTADIVSDALGIPYEVTDALREYDCGILENQSDEESWKLHRQYFEDWTLRRHYTSKPEGGECFLDIQRRFVPFIENLKSNNSYKDADILLIGHGGLFLLMLPLILSNVDHPFVVAQGIGNAEYVLAEQKQNSWVCLQWGDLIFHEIEGTEQ